MKISGQSDRMVSAGQTEDIVVTIPTSRRRGKLTRKVTVSTNDPNNPKVYLECATKVLTALHIDPPTISFGQVHRTDTEKKKTITITRGDGGPLNPKVGKTSGHQGILADLREIEAGEKYELELTIQPPWPNGTLRGSVAIETGVEQAPEETLSFYASIPPRLRVNPQRFIVRPNAPQPVELTARLQWSGGPANKVTKATVNDSALKVRVDERDGRQVLVLEVPADYRPRRRSGNLVMLETDDPSVKSVRVPIYVSSRLGGRTSPRRTSPARPTGPVRKIQPTRQPAGQPSDKPISTTAK